MCSQELVGGYKFSWSRGCLMSGSSALKDESVLACSHTACLRFHSSQRSNFRICIEYRIYYTEPLSTRFPWRSFHTFIVGIELRRWSFIYNSMFKLGIAYYQAATYIRVTRSTRLSSSSALDTVRQAVGMHMWIYIYTSHLDIANVSGDSANESSTDTRLIPCRTNSTTRTVPSGGHDVQYGGNLRRSPATLVVLALQGISRIKRSQKRIGVDCMCIMNRISVSLTR